MATVAKLNSALVPPLWFCPEASLTLAQIASTIPMSNQIIVPVKNNKFTVTCVKKY